jgi:hypothetical protein
MTTTAKGMMAPILGMALTGVLTLGACGATSDGASDIEVQHSAQRLSAPYSLLGLINESIYSDNGLYRLTMQNDCNLVLYAPNAIWSSKTYNGSNNCVARMQDDGNFVVYNGSRALWASNTWGHPGAYLELQDDRNLVVYDTNRHALWASNTWIPTSGSCWLATPYPGQCPGGDSSCRVKQCSDGSTRPYSGNCGSYCLQ